MTEQEILLVAGLAGLALSLTLVDLLLSLVRHLRGRSAARASGQGAGIVPGEEVGVAAGGRTITRRLAAIEAAGQQQTTSARRG